MRPALLSLIGFGLLVLVGCSQDFKPQPTPKNDAPIVASTPPVEAKPVAKKNVEECCGEDDSKPVVSVSAKPNDAPVQIQVVKYNQLKDAVKAQKGKIVVVDVWATFCIPCMKEFPHLVELHHEHAKDGVVCMSVSIDDLEKKEAALKFLQSKGATFPNFLLDEEAEVWQKNWNASGVPIVFVFARDGAQAAKFNDDNPDKQFTYKDVKAKVEELLKQ